MQSQNFNTTTATGEEAITLKFKPASTYFTLKLIKFAILVILTLGIYLKTEYLPVLLLLIPAVLMGCYEAINLNSKYAILESEQLILHQGMLNYTTEYLELYRINHIEVRQTLIMKLFKVFELQLTTGDDKLKQVILKGIDSQLLDSPALIRKLVQECKLKYRVFTMSGNPA